MSNLVARFISPNAGAILYVNGFVVVGSDEAGRFNQPIAPYLRPGVNVIEIASRLPGAAQISVVDMQGDDPEAVPVLLQTEGPVPLPAQTYWRGEVVLPADAPAFAWHRASRLTNIDAQKATIYGFLQTLQQLLTSGPDPRLLSLLEIKHTEIASAVGIGKDEMDRGLTEGLSNLRRVPGFRIDLVASAKDLSLVLSSDGKIVNARRADGSDALKIIDGEVNGGFSAAFATVDSRWILAR